MADPALTGEIRDFFEQYTKAFDSVDGNRIAALYCMPTVRSALATMDWELRRADGSVVREWRQSYNVVLGRTCNGC